MQKKKISVVITDLDNTLFNWFDIWYYPFSAMIEKIVADSGVPHDDLLSEIKTVHERHGTAEYNFLLEEIPLLQAKNLKSENTIDLYSEAIEVFRKVRKEHMKLYPGVMNTLRTLKENGCIIVGYTESMELYTNYRIKKLELDGVLDYLFSSANHKMPDSISPDEICKYPSRIINLRYTNHQCIPQGEYKPNPKVLTDIINVIGAESDECLYIGDSLVKDVAMANDASVTSVYAKYGTVHLSEEYELLRKVTHWSAEQVEEEKVIKERDVKPDYICHNSYSEILSLFHFEPFSLKITERESKIINVWEKTIDTQQHFNNIEIQIRNFAITSLGAFLAAIILSVEKNLFIQIHDFSLSVASCLCLGALIVWGAFFFMDRFWYHPLLLGSVKYGMEIEKTNKDIFGNEGLTTIIKNESPIKVFKKEIHSKGKFYAFYGSGAVVLSILAILLNFVRPTINVNSNVQQEKQPTVVNTKPKPTESKQPIVVDTKPKPTESRQPTVVDTKPK